MAALVGIGRSQGLRFELAERVTLGRHAGATYVIADPLVSGRHAEIRRGSNGRYYLHDPSSTHGTYVNGARVTEVMLADGDEIVLGATRLRFEEGGGAVPREVDVRVGSEKHVIQRRVTMSEAANARDHTRLQVAFEIGQLLAAKHDVDGMLRVLLERSFALVPAERGALLMLEQTGKLVLRMARRKDDASDPVLIPHSILDEVVTQRVGVLSIDASLDDRFGKAASVLSAGVRAALSVPLVHDTQLFGVLYLDARSAGVFSERDLEVLALVAGQTALSVSTARLRAAVEQQERLAAVSQVAAGIGHDFANLLTMILSSAEVISQDEAVPAEHRENARNIETAATHAARLTRRLSLLARGGPTEHRSIDLAHFLGESIEMIRGLLGARFRVSLQRPERPLRILADQTELEQVMLNLAFNARDAMPGEGEIAFSLSSEQIEGREHAVLEVRDSGAGMSPEVLQRIFEPFYTTKAPGRGTGMGLAVVHRIVSQARGRVSARSIEGQGTTFRIEWPATATISDTAARATNRARGELVLVLDDDDAVRELMVTMLERAGYTVVQARTCDEALAASAAASGLRAVIVDLVLSGPSGRQFVERLRAMRPEVRVLYVSGYVEAAEIDELTAMGAGFLAKPFSERDLAARLQAVVAGEAAAPMVTRSEITLRYADGAALLADYDPATMSLSAPANLTSTQIETVLAVQIESLAREFRIRGHVLAVGDQLRIELDRDAESARELILASARGESVPYFRRSEERRPVRLEVRLRSETGLAIVSHTQNISARGLMLTTDHRLEVGTRVALRIVFPGEEPVTIAGKVQSRRTGPLRGLGIELVYTSEDQREAFARRLAALG